jgi:hypothetical protein
MKPIGSETDKNGTEWDLILLASFV